jgi:hypothetical protein
VLETVHMAQSKFVRPTCNLCQLPMWLSRVQDAYTNPATCTLHTFQCAVCGATETVTLDRWSSIETAQQRVDDRRVEATHPSRAPGTAQPHTNGR